MTTERKTEKVSERKAAIEMEFQRLMRVVAEYEKRATHPAKEG